MYWSPELGKAIDIEHNRCLSYLQDAVTRERNLPETKDSIRARICGPFGFQVPEFEIAVSVFHPSFSVVPSGLAGRDILWRIQMNQGLLSSCRLAAVQQIWTTKIEPVGGGIVWCG